MVDGRLIGERTCTAAAPSCSSGATLQYFVLDHLGSVAVVTDGTAAVTSRESFDAWGKQRNEDGTDDTTCSNGLTSPTTRGFTSQEEIAALCLVNLNARIYDPTIGRFMAADTIVPDAYDGQSYNRYSYTDNRPLTLTDPTGHIDEGFYYNLNLLPPDSYPNASCSGPGCGATSSGFEIGGTLFVTSMTTIGLNSNGEFRQAPDKASGGELAVGGARDSKQGEAPSDSNPKTVAQTGAAQNADPNGIETVVVQQNRLPSQGGSCAVGHNCRDIPPMTDAAARSIIDSLHYSRAQSRERGAVLLQDKSGVQRVLTGKGAGTGVPGEFNFAFYADDSLIVGMGHSHMVSPFSGIEGSVLTGMNEGPSSVDQAGMEQTNAPQIVVAPDVTTQLYRIGNQDYLSVLSGDRSKLPDMSVQHIVVVPP